MKPEIKDLITGTIIFFLDIFLLYFLWKNNLALTSAFAILSVILLLFLTCKEEKFTYFIGFILGPIYDITLVPAGIWTYGNPTLFSVPIWLPLTYGLSLVSILKISRSTYKIFFR